MTEHWDMALAGRQLARLSTDRCREVEAALISGGYLSGKPSALQLEYPHGGCWRIPTHDERLVVLASLTPRDGADWVLRIEPAAPIRPRVVFRTGPSEAHIRAVAKACYDVALLLNEALSPLCPELRWEETTETGEIVSRRTPVPPAF